MTRKLLLLTTFALFSAGSALAQDTGETADTSDAEAQTETEAPHGGGIGGGLDLGEDAAAAPTQPGNPQQPETYVRDTYDDWDLQCLPVEDGEDVCQMYQLLTDGQGNSVAEVSIFRLAGEGQAVAGGTFVVPLETLLTQQLTVSVDGGAARRYDFAFCNRIGCYARVGLTAEDVARFKAGASAQVQIVPALAPDQRVTLDMSLAGFTAAYDEASEVTP
ncbi:invasion associated locus B family protein [Allosediminivita pacifica]|uniref:Invasion protein IalB n=1 Tax=Allosediminivita pacifica TaxID=1267769 RepID=A0A2T6AYF3_9RHOB|nr:invasion associated locus B family protein [Allosediminivita pacifica]PTX48832.1 invasion protein IalB [Allosediminivita pacifica]GGB08629.1 invasion-associated locus B family protein [Allosediminivita pacifica]